MHTFFLLCIGIGVVALVLQIGAGLLGAGHDAHVDLEHDGAHGLHEGLELLSVRSLAAGLAVFGAIGLWLEAPLSPPLAMAVALPWALGAMAGTAYLTRLMLRLQSSGSLKLEDAVGAIGTVYLAVPPDGEGTGLIHVPLQERSVELRALTRETDALPRGSSVLVISVDAENETVEVVATSKVKGLLE